MVSREMLKWGKPVVTLSQKEYRKLEGLLRECLPSHIPIDIERVKNNIKLWSRHPRVTIKAVEKARRLLKEYGTKAMAVMAEEKAGKAIEKPIKLKNQLRRKKVVKKKVKKKK